MRTHKVLAILAAAAMALAIAVTPASAGPKTFRATRPFVVDRQTGVLRMPTVAEVATLVETLTTAGQQPAENLPAPVQTNGAVALDLAGSFAGVVLARPNADGTWETRCVFTVEEGAEFLGLVEEVQ